MSRDVNCIMIDCSHSAVDYYKSLLWVRDFLTFLDQEDLLTVVVLL